MMMATKPRMKPQTSLPVDLKPIKINSSPFQPASESDKGAQNRIETGAL